MNRSCLCPTCTLLTMEPCLPALTPIPDTSENWEVDCHWMSPLVNERAMLIKRLFVTDGASIPRFAWHIVGHPFSKNLLPHCLGHDALYAGELMPRKECDDWMFDSMAIALHHFPLGVSVRVRNEMWAAVRAGGWYVWNRHTTATVEAAKKQVRLLLPGEWAVYSGLAHV